MEMIKQNLVSLGLEKYIEAQIEVSLATLKKQI